MLLMLPAALGATVQDLVTEMTEVATANTAAPAVLADWHALVDSLDLADTPSSLLEYSRVRLAFETTRDGGLWGLRWAVTNQDPTERFIWASLLAWHGAEVTAVAECDELSAMFASLARAMGVRDVGLFWPTWNHTVAVWTTPGEAGNVRVVVPTSQIFLAAGETLGTNGFDPSTQRTIYRYGTKALPLNTALTPELYRRLSAPLVESARPAAELQRERDARAARVGGS